MGRVDCGHIADIVVKGDSSSVVCQYCKRETAFGGNPLRQFFIKNPGYLCLTSPITALF